MTRARLTPEALQSMAVATKVVATAVLRVLATTNRFVTATEVLEAMLPAECDALAVASARGAGDAVRRRVRYLYDAGYLQSNAFLGQERLFGHDGMALPAGATATKPSSYRADALKAATRAAEKLERAVRIEDVRVELGTRTGELPNDLSRALVSLEKHGDLHAVHVGHGRRSGGTHHYLPLILVPIYGDKYVTDSNMDRVMKAFLVAWKRHTEEARLVDNLITPITPADIVEHLRDAEDDQEANYTSVLDALRSFERLRQPPIRRVYMHGSVADDALHLGWVPMTVLDGVVDKNGGRTSDSRRAADAVQRAAAATGVAAITRADVTEICANDADHNSPEKVVSIVALESAARVTLNHSGRRSSRRDTYLLSLGRVGKTSYFCVPDLEAEAANEMRFHRLIAEVDGIALDIEIRRISQATVPSIFAARLRAARRELTGFRSRMIDCRGALATGHPLLARIAESEAVFDGWGRDLDMMLLQRSVPTATEGVGSEVSTEIINYQQVLDRINTMMSSVGHRENASDVRSLLGSRIRFLRNSQFVRWTTGDPSTASLYVYDRVEVDMALASEFGNDEERHHGLLAQRELGHCRDMPAVLAGMRDTRPEVRMAAIAAAGFLGGVEMGEELRSLVAAEPDSNVTASLNWAADWLGRTQREAAVLQGAESGAQGYGLPLPPGFRNSLLRRHLKDR